MSKRLPTYFISHGGDSYCGISDMRTMMRTLEVSLANMPQEIGVTPKAILMVSGHWEADDFAIMSSPAPGMVYDYGGFPPYTYQIKYAAPAPRRLPRARGRVAESGRPAHPP